MKIAHIAIWVKDLEMMKDFYVKYFDGVSNEKYVNPTKKFSSYFVSFEEGATLELMHKPEISELQDRPNEFLGITHIAFQLSGKKHIDDFCANYVKDGYKVIGQPRLSGDGFYEAVIADPEGNRLEIVA